MSRRSRRTGGLKHADDHPEARWLTHRLRLELLPAGSIDPKAERALRDLLRQRSQLVRQKTSVVLNLQSRLARLTGTRFSLRRLTPLTAETLTGLVPFPAQVLSVTRSLTVLECLAEPIRQVELTARHEGQPRPGGALLQTVTGVDPILALTILLETDNIHHVAIVGPFASSYRCVSGQHRSNGTCTGRGNTKNGTKYLSWAFVGAAHVALRDEPLIRRFDQRKATRTAACIALKAVAHKLARACDHILRAQVPRHTRCQGRKEPFDTLLPSLDPDRGRVRLRGMSRHHRNENGDARQHPPAERSPRRDGARRVILTAVCGKIRVPLDQSLKDGCPLCLFLYGHDAGERFDARDP